MRIKSIEVKNFKSFRHVQLELSKFNVLIGPNAAGKSNFINIFRFFRDIIHDGLDNAISIQGGSDYLRNVKLRDKENYFSYKITITPDKDFKFERAKAGILYHLEIFEVEYEFSLDINEEASEYEIISDRMTQRFRVYQVNPEDIEFIASSAFYINKSKTDFNIEFDELVPEVKLTSEDLKHVFFIGYEALIQNKKLLSRRKLASSLLIEMPLYFAPYIENLKSDIERMSIYDFQPKLPKQATSFEGKAELEETGENLAIVLKKIMSGADKRRMLYNLLNHIIPYIENIEVKKVLDQYLQIYLKETYSGDKDLPAFLLSDGTIFILTIIISLYFENKPFIIFDEAGRRIHPNLISKLTDMMEDASNYKQIIISTHNPQIVKNIKLEHLIFLSRDEDGYTAISRPHEKQEIQTFLSNEIGIDELFVQNLLG